MTNPVTGICAAVYSLRSTGGAGIGDFGDVRHVPWPPAKLFLRVAARLDGEKLRGGLRERGGVLHADRRRLRPLVQIHRIR